MEEDFLGVLTEEGFLETFGAFLDVLAEEVFFVALAEEVFVAALVEEVFVEPLAIRADLRG